MHMRRAGRLLPTGRRDPNPPPPPVAIPEVNIGSRDAASVVRKIERARRPQRLRRVGDGGGYDAGEDLAACCSSCSVCSRTGGARPRGGGGGGGDGGGGERRSPRVVAAAAPPRAGMSQRRLERWLEQHNYSHAEVEQVADRLKVILKQLGRRGRQRADAAATGGDEEGGEAARVAVGGIASTPHAVEGEAADDEADDGTSDDDADDVGEAAAPGIPMSSAHVDGRW